jgi:Uma2 family endonuclease
MPFTGSHVVAERALKTMTVEQFLVWHRDQEDRYELVEGFPVKMMTGASDFHDRIVTNVIGALYQQLRGKSCRVATADLAIRTRIKGVRRGDAIVNCAPLKGDQYEAEQPRFILEVLSKSNTGVEWQRKLEEYRRLKDLRYLLIVDSQVQSATLFTRMDTDWVAEDADGLDHTFDLPAIECRLAMQDIYEDLDLLAPPSRANDA